MFIQTNFPILTDLKRRCFQISRPIKDLKGQKFGKLYVSSMNRLQNHRVYWNCECDCGCCKIVRGDLLKAGTITDCGCVFKQKDKNYRENIVGRRFGKLTVTNEKTSKYRCGDIKYLCDCICDCSNKITVIRSRLIDGKVTMCPLCRKSNDYDLESYEYGVGYCSDGYRFLFDKEDYDKIKTYRWRRDQNGYLRTHIDNNHDIFMHSLIYGDKELRDIENIKADMKLKGLKGKEYIYSIGKWAEYISYLKEVVE